MEALMDDKPGTEVAPKLCRSCGKPITQEFNGDSGCCSLECYKALGHGPKRGLSSLMSALMLSTLAYGMSGECGSRRGSFGGPSKQKSKTVRDRRTKNRAAKASRKKNRRR